METIILLGPLVGAIICGFGWRLIGETAAQWVATGMLFFVCLLSWIAFITFDMILDNLWISSVSMVQIIIFLDQVALEVFQ